MSRWLIFGAGSGVGAHLLNIAQQQQHPCLAFIRNPTIAQELRNQGIQVIEGDARNADAVEYACQLAGIEATIISTMGGIGTNYDAHRLVIDQAEKAGIKRMLLVTSLGCSDTWQWRSERSKARSSMGIREKSLAESWLQTSSLDYCILRPGGLRDGEATYQAKRYVQQEVHGFIHRHDVALHIAELVNQPNLGNTIYSIVDPSLQR